jgi:protein transport protein YIF1
MAFVTYILLSAFLSGIQGHFNPEDFSVTASYAFAVVLFEIVAIKFGCYLLSIGGQGQVLDLVAYGGYKFVGIVVTMLVRLVGILSRREGAGNGMGRWIEWGVFIYCFLGLGFFMVCPLFFSLVLMMKLRSLKYLILSDGGQSVDVGVGTNRGKAKRVQFLSAISVVQLVFMWLLTGNA